MDPLSISATVVSLAAKCMQTAKFLHDLHGKFKYAEVTIRAVCSESMIIGATLSKLQTLMIEHPEILTDRMQSHSQMEDIFDVVLTGCMVVYSVLDEEIQRILPDPDNLSQIGFMTRAKYIWDEDTMQSLLRDIRGQQIALTALIQVLQLDSIIEMQKQIKKSGMTFDNVARSTRRLRSTRASARDTRSIYDTTFDTQRLVVRGDMSMVSSTEFAFDDLIVNSTVYRRAMLAASRDGFQASTPSRENGLEEELLQSSESVRTVKQDNSSSTLVSDSITQSASSPTQTVRSKDVSTAGTQTDGLLLANTFKNYRTSPPSHLLDVARYISSWDRSDRLSAHIGKSDYSEQDLLYALARKFEFVAQPQQDISAKHDELLTKYSKVKRYYFEIEAHVKAMTEQLNGVKDFLKTNWSTLSKLQDVSIPFSEDNLGEHFLIWFSLIGPKPTTMLVAVKKEERAQSVVNRISVQLQMNLDGWTIFWRHKQQYLPADMAMGEIWSEEPSEIPWVNLRPVAKLDTDEPNQAATGSELDQKATVASKSAGLDSGSVASEAHDATNALNGAEETLESE